MTDDVKNVILFIGDGMGDSEITVARNYAEGAGGFFKGIDALPLTGQYTHYALDRDDRQAELRDRFGGLRHGLGDRAPRPTTARSASTSRERRTRPCSSSPRLPASAPATSPPPNSRTPRRRCRSPTSPLRSCYGPEVDRREVPEGRAGERRLGLDQRAAAQHPPRRDARRRGQELRRDRQGRRLEGQDRCSSRPRRAASTVVTDSTSCNAVDRRRTTARRCSACSPPATCRSAGRVRRPALTATSTSRRSPARPTPSGPAACRRWRDMTTKAIDLLDGATRKGFFLQVEGASIDKQDHAANPCGQIGETVDLDEAVQVGAGLRQGRRQDPGHRHRRPCARQPDRRATTPRRRA